jgi:hypothetical protein
VTEVTENPHSEIRNSQSGDGVTEVTVVTVVTVVTENPQSEIRLPQSENKVIKINKTYNTRNFTIIFIFAVQK